MFGSLFNSPVWHLISISDWISKYIILLGLFFLSIICVAIIIFKWVAFRQQRIAMKTIMREIKTCKTSDDLVKLSKQHPHSAGGKLLAHSLNRLAFILQQKKEPSQKKVTLTKEAFEQLELLIDQDINNLLFKEEIYLPVLGTSAAAGPLIGLFGTIWGLIQTFISISQEKTTDIAIIAPGIAAALLTTLAGLVVAIPAMIYFHYFSNELRKLESQLTDLSEIVMLMFKHAFTK